MVTRQQFYRYFFALLILAQAVLALAWMAGNLHIVPFYGDTADYIERAKTLAVHKMRPFTLPLILRFCMEASERHTFNLLFLVQTGLALAGLWLLLGIIAPERRGLDKVLIFLAAGTNPLLTHFNFTVLPDSLALSLAFLAAAALWKAICREKLSWPWTLLFMAAFTLAINARGERIVSLSLGLMAGLLLLIALRRLPLGRVGRIACCFCLGFCCHLGASGILPKSDLAVGLNYNFTVYHMICSNIVFTRAERLLPLFPEEVRAALPLEEARTWDKNANYFYTVRERLDPLGENVYKEMIFTAIRHDWPHLLFRLGAASVHYTLSAIYPYFYFTGISPDKQPESWSGFTWFYGAQNWTFTRMAGFPAPVLAGGQYSYSGLNGHSPRLTWWYWLVASILVQAVLIRGVLLFIKSFQDIKLNGGAGVFFAIAMLTTALVFAANPCLVHIRYALTWHVFALAALFCLALPALGFARPAEARI